MSPIPETIDLHEKRVNLASKIQFLMKKNHVSYSQLAESLEIPVMTIRRIAGGETTDPRISTLKAIAEYFETSVDSLINNTPFVVQKSSLSSIPLLSWQALEENIDIKSYDLKSHARRIGVAIEKDKNHTENMFALESRPFMFPKFIQGTILIFAPNEPPTDGDTVLVRLKKTKEITAKILHIDPPEWQLGPISGSAGTQLRFNPLEHEIIAPCILTLLYKRGDAVYYST